MSTYIDEIDVWKPDPPAETALSKPPAPAEPRPPTKWKTRAADAITWIIITCLLVGGGYWAYLAGMDLRHRFWIDTRSVRFLYDINNGYQFGNAVLREAEHIARLPTNSDALANQTPAVTARMSSQIATASRAGNLRRLTQREVFEGIVQFYDRRLVEASDGEFQLDYPPLRLTAMTLWVRQAQRLHPELARYPNRSQAADGYSAPQVEDVITRPALLFNTACSGAAAIMMFLLVWLWMDRDARALTASAPVSSSRRRWAVPHGMLAFAAATGAFWYAFNALIGPPLRPPPTVRITQVVRAGESVKVIGIVDPQLNATRARVDWGPSTAYGRTTRPQNAGARLGETPFSATLEPVAPGEIVHLRISASNAGGTSSTEDVEIPAGDMSTEVDKPAFGGIVWPSWTVWARMLVLFLAMVVFARMLPPRHRGWACGFVAGMLVWFNPLTIVDSIGWPQWDVWILPAVIGAILLASLDWWLTAGLVLGIGCMFKGQLLLGAPIFILWPLMGGRFGAVLRLFIGLALGAGFIVWPWIIPGWRESPDAIPWIMAVLFAAMLCAAVSLLRPWLWRSIANATFRGQAWPSRRDWIGTITVAILAFASLFFGRYLINRALPSHSDSRIGEVSYAVLLILLLPWLLPRRALGYWLTAMLALAIWITPSLFGGSWSWLDIGFEYGTVKHEQMAMGIDAFSNLAAILNSRFDWNLHDSVGTLGLGFTSPASWQVAGQWMPQLSYQHIVDLDLKTSAVAVYAICLVICGIAAAAHSRRHDARLLAAVIAPWLIFPMVLGQMSERYLVWGSAASAALIAVSTGGVLLHALLAIFASGMCACQLLRADPGRWPQVNHFFRDEFPQVGWMMILIAGLFLMIAIAPGRRWKGRGPASTSPSPG